MSKTKRDQFDEYAGIALLAIIPKLGDPVNAAVYLAERAHLLAAAMMAENERWAETNNMASPFERLSEEP